MKRILLVFSLIAALAAAGLAGSMDPTAAHESVVPKDGFVPDEETAKKIAEAVLLPIYGQQIEIEKPYRARLQNDVWIVEGTLPPNLLGGVFYIRSRKQDGAILYVEHGQ